MAIGALVVAIVSLVLSGFAVWYARRQAVAAEGATELEASRRHEEMTPRLRVTINADVTVNLRLRVFLAGPAELGRLDGLTVTIRDDRPGRAGESRIAGGSSREEVAAQVWGPFRFVPGSGPGDQVADAAGRVTPTAGMPVGESRVFVLTPTEPPPSSSWTQLQWRGEVGTAIRLQLECSRAGESWSLPCEINSASFPVTVEVP
jgi:hypothetical protein